MKNGDLYMKDYYKINEISKLYGIGVDSLRYYEKLGLLSPKRDTNGYRLYNLKDMYKLTIIRNLRELDFPVAQIKSYLDCQTLDNTLQLLHSEQELLKQRLLKIQEQSKLIHERIATLTAAREIPTGIVTVKTMPVRRCVRLSQHITRDEEMDFIIKRLHRKYEAQVRDIGTQQIGAFFSMEDIKQGASNVYDSVFFVLDGESTEETSAADADTATVSGADCDFILPAGTYLSCYYRGNYEQNADRLREIFEFVNANALCPLGNAFELYEVDNRDTIVEEEFLTEIQLLISTEV